MRTDCVVWEERRAILDFNPALAPLMRAAEKGMS